MSQRFHAGDIILQVNWRAYYLVTGTNCPCPYDATKENYQFQLLAVEEKNAAAEETTLYRTREYIDGRGSASWQKAD